MYLSKKLPKCLKNRLIRIYYARKLLSCGIPLNKILNSIIFDEYIEADGFKLSNYGVWLKSKNNDKTFNFALRSYRNGLEKILNKLDSNFIFLDIGSNQGVFSLVANQNFFCKKIVCYEPNKKIVNYLKHNLEFNKVRDFAIYKFAISSKNGSALFFSSDTHSGDGHFTSKNGNLKVNTVNKMHLNKISRTLKYEIIVKIDVQGMEFEVINELFKSKLKENIKYLFIENDPKYGNYHHIVNFLALHDFSEVKKFGARVHSDMYFQKNIVQKM
jgi:FkbM family methyltransferase